LLLSAVMMLRHIGEKNTADRVQKAIETVYREGKHLTHDTGGTATTTAFTDAVIAAMTRN